MSIGAGAQATGVDKLCAESLSPLLQGTGELTTMITAYLAGIGVNFLLTPVAGVSTFTVPLAELTNSIGISPFAPVYSFLYGLDQYVLPYEYAVFLYFFSTGYIHLKHLIQVFAVRAIITFIRSYRPIRDGKVGRRLADLGLTFVLTFVALVLATFMSVTVSVLVSGSVVVMTVLTLIGIVGLALLVAAVFHASWSRSLQAWRFRRDGRKMAKREDDQQAAEAGAELLDGLSGR